MYYTIKNYCVLFSVAVTTWRETGQSQNAATSERRGRGLRAKSQELRRPVPRSARILSTATDGGRASMGLQHQQQDARRLVGHYSSL